jgi:Ricin-type beta-trefoil lectin domain-like
VSFLCDVKAWHILTPLFSQHVDPNLIATGNGVPIQTYLWSQGTNQQWQPVSLGDGQWKFAARNSGRCLDVPRASKANNVVLDQYDCNGTNAQAFYLTLSRVTATDFF